MGHFTFSHTEGGRKGFVKSFTLSGIERGAKSFRPVIFPFSRPLLPFQVINYCSIKSGTHPFKG